MIRRSVKIQLAAFAVISIVGIAYVGASYVGIRLPWRPGPYKVTVVLQNSGGIFTNADVTERGVTVGRVGALDVHDDGVHVELDIEHSHRIPADARATVANLSAVGEQYIDLEPQTDAAPYLHSGSVIPKDRTTVPLEDAQLLVDLDQLVNSVDKEHLATVIDELGKGFDDLGPQLQQLIDNGNLLTQAAIDSLPQQLKLINDGVTVLDTQRAVGDEIKAYAHTFAQFSDQLRRSDPDLRGVFDNGVASSQQLTSLLKSNEAALPTLLGNLITGTQIQAVRLPQVRTTLLLFPAQVAGGFYVTPGDGTAHFGQVNDNANPCTEGYSSTKLRSNNEKDNKPSDWGGPANLDAFCKSSDPTVDQRGSRYVERPDNSQVTNSDPYPGPVYGKSTHPTVAQQDDGGFTGRSEKTSSSSSSSSSSNSAAPDSVVPLPYDPATGVVTGTDGKSYQLGFNGPLDRVFGSSSWEWLLLAPTMK